ncbi:hypothetical protein GCM10027436_41930 [Actinophytocola sediminis]
MQLRIARIEVREDAGGDRRIAHQEVQLGQFGQTIELALVSGGPCDAGDEEQNPHLMVSKIVTNGGERLD